MKNIRASQSRVDSDNSISFRRGAIFGFLGWRRLGCGLVVMVVDGTIDCLFLCLVALLCD